MKQNQKLECPVNFKPVNETKVRLVAFFIFVLSSTYCLYPHWSIAIILVTDFFLRSFKFGRFSLLGILSEWLIKLLSLPYKPVDSAAKEFAALIGFVISDILFILSALYLYKIGVYVNALLLCFSFLESVFGFCAGCYVYTFFKKLKVKALPVSGIPS